MPRWSPFDPYFWSLVKTTKTCWVWRGNVDSKGYGRIWYQGKRQRAHRVAWTLINREIPDGLLVCHHCDNRLCVRPDHLFLGTQKDNMQDWTKKGKNRLINDRSLWKRGDDNWMRQEKSKEFRERHSARMKEELSAGRRVVIRDSKGRIMGTKYA